MPPIVLNTAPLLKPAFEAAQFTPTKFNSAAAKAKFANDLCKFIAAGFPDSKFNKKFYNQLSMTFGHIAHYNRDGFFNEFFMDISGKINFLEQTLAYPCYGSPDYTFCDVEKAIQDRLWASGLSASYQALRRAEIEQAERATLARLSAKFADPAQMGLF
jgi:hypothetical protein